MLMVLLDAVGGKDHMSKHAGTRWNFCQVLRAGHAAGRIRRPNECGCRGRGVVGFEGGRRRHAVARLWRCLGHGEVPCVFEAAWLHHRFTQIHPFQDGNGRVARALATLVCLRAGGFPLVVRGRQKREYISALEAADQGDLRPLTGLFERQQRDALVGAISLAPPGTCRASRRP